jgi:hypothetical protein
MVSVAYVLKSSFRKRVGLCLKPTSDDLYKPQGSTGILCIKLKESGTLAYLIHGNCQLEKIMEEGFLPPKRRKSKLKPKIKK